MTDANHLTPEDFYHFIDGGLDGLGRVESHLAECPECLETLAMIVRGRDPLTSQEEAALNELPQRSPEGTLERLRPLIVATWKQGEA